MIPSTFNQYFFYNQYSHSAQFAISMHISNYLNTFYADKPLLKKLQVKKKLRESFFIYKKDRHVIMQYYNIRK